jgi:hypothetical protein
LIGRLSIGVAKAVFLGLSGLLGRLPEFGEALYMYWFIIKGVAKDTGENMCKIRHLGRDS